MDSVIIPLENVRMKSAVRRITAEFVLQTSPCIPDCNASIREQE